jgi:hypothetical protein
MIIRLFFTFSLFSFFDRITSNISLVDLRKYRFDNIVAKCLLTFTYPRKNPPAQQFIYGRFTASLRGARIEFRTTVMILLSVILRLALSQSQQQLPFSVPFDVSSYSGSFQLVQGSLGAIGYYRTDEQYAYFAVASNSGMVVERVGIAFAQCTHLVAMVVTSSPNRRLRRPWFELRSTVNAGSGHLHVSRSYGIVDGHCYLRHVRAAAGHA